MNQKEIIRLYLGLFVLGVVFLIYISLMVLVTVSVSNV